MMPILSGTIQNAVKLDMLNHNVDIRKKHGFIPIRQDIKKQLEKTPEQQMLDRFREEMEQNRENSKNYGIANKIMNGEELSPEEEQYLAQNNPAQLSNYRRMKAEAHAYEEKLRKCKTKDDVEELKTNTINGYLSEMKGASGDAAAGIAMEIMGKVKNILKAEAKFIQSGEYAQLPTKGEIAVEKAEERSAENEVSLDKLIESVETNDVETEPVEVETVEAGTEEAKSVETESIKNSLSKLEEICGRYVPNLDVEIKIAKPVEERKKIDLSV